MIEIRNAIAANAHAAMTALNASRFLYTCRQATEETTMPFVSFVRSDEDGKEMHVSSFWSRRLNMAILKITHHYVMPEIAPSWSFSNK